MTRLDINTMNYIRCKLLNEELYEVENITDHLEQCKNEALKSKYNYTLDLIRKTENKLITLLKKEELNDISLLETEQQIIIYDELITILIRIESEIKGNKDKSFEEIFK